ncbi:hypothetical protein [Leifsonia sp. 71-9]|uniref:DUF7341 domain-containing protein n=1 Tax=Leifsonia sp. 71-9 TaxID=1895934 RepID=UPI000928B5D5|nr:hypothetical protein [Leifsonia sp. 71-9]OJX72817.1 MAG: hypothetical protein BGO91_13690 [Leifsonia sp. 71-9]
MSETDPLLAAVEALTKPVVEKVRQFDDDGNHLKTWTVEHAPLLDQFREAVIPSSNTAAGSSALASTRNILDSTALYEYSKIASQTADWCRIINVTAVKDARLNLVHWLPRFSKLNSDPEAAAWYITQLCGWANLIRAHMDPPRRRSITYPCPICGKRTWTGPDGEGGTWPLELLYRLDDNDKPVILSAICKACDPVTTWTGHDAVEELIGELEERHAG